jgi:hypothetical protein
MHDHISFCFLLFSSEWGRNQLGHASMVVARFLASDSSGGGGKSGNGEAKDAKQAASPSSSSATVPVRVTLLGGTKCLGATAERDAQVCKEVRGEGTPE